MTAQHALTTWCAPPKRLDPPGVSVHGPPRRLPASSAIQSTTQGSPAMSFSMSKATLPALEMGLNALSGVLDKGAAYAAAKKIDPTVLVQSRLAPDMFALARQVQIACDMAKNGSARLAGVDPPPFEDKEATLDELKARVAKTVAYVKSLDGKKIDASEDRQITFPLGP